MIMMKIVEKNVDNLLKIKQYYDDDIVLFEHTILESDQFIYSICYCPRLDVYDVLLEDTVNCKLVNYEARRQLSGSTLKYFNVYKDDVVSDMFGNRFNCITHYVEIQE